MSDEYIANKLVFLFKKIYDENNYRYYDNKLNILGIRNTTSPQMNRFDDKIYIWKYIDNKLLFYGFKATTDPGKYYLNKPLNKKGTAVLLPGHYKDAYIIGKHKNKYDALVQRGRPVKICRDNDYDSISGNTCTTIEEGYFGINIHRASKYKIVQFVERYSAGCQVIQNYNDFELFMKLIKEDSKHRYYFDYTLINSSNIYKYNHYLYDIFIEDFFGIKYL